MKQLLSIVLFCVLGIAGKSFALPPCPTSGVKDNCFATYTWPDGHKYSGNKWVGEWKDDLPHGQGTHTWPDGSKYVGEVKDDKMHGQGTYTHADGGKYVGEWKDDIWHGHGEVSSKGRKLFVGKFKNGKEHGQGTFTWDDGSKYVGEWKSGKKHGQGAKTWPSGDKYVGEWKNDNRHGQGTYTRPSGDKYVGEYKDGFRWNGTTYSTTYKADDTVEGTYSNGKWTPKSTSSKASDRKLYTQRMIQELVALLQAGRNQEYCQRMVAASESHPGVVWYLADFSPLTVDGCLAQFEADDKCRQIKGITEGFQDEASEFLGIPSFGFAFAGTMRNYAEACRVWFTYTGTSYSCRVAEVHTTTLGKVLAHRVNSGRGCQKEQN